MLYWSTMIHHTLPLAITVLIVAACAAPSAVPGGRPIESSAVPSATPGTTPSPAARDVAQPAGAPEAVLDAAREAYAKTGGVAIDAVTVVHAEPVTWPDSSLGCPQPGQMYLQVLTPGYRVTVAAGDKRTVYHTTDGANGPVQAIQCGSDARSDLALGSLSAAPLDKARRDLAARIGSAADIRLVKDFVAGVTKLSCENVPALPSPGGSPAFVVFEFHLQSGDSVYKYRAAGDNILYCGPISPLPVDEAGNPTQ
jgi:hypothetical protein